MEENEIMEQEKVEKGIRIGKDYILKNDAMNLILEQYGIRVNMREKDESKRESYGLINKTYHRTLQQVFNHIINNTMYKVDFGDLKDVNAKIVELQNAIIEFKRCTRLKEETLEVIK